MRQPSAWCRRSWSRPKRARSRAADRRRARRRSRSWRAHSAKLNGSSSSSNSGAAMRHTGMGVTMPGIWRSPSGMVGNASPSARTTSSLARISPGPALSHRRDARLIDMPMKSSPSNTITRPAATPIRNGSTMLALCIRSVRSRTVSTTGRTSVPTNMQPSPSHLPTRMPWSGDRPRTIERNSARTASASSSPRVSFMRVKPHMSTKEKHRKTRTPTVWPMTGPVQGLLVAGREVDAVDAVEQVGAATAVEVDQLGDPGERQQDAGVVGTGRRLRQQLPGPGDLGVEDLVVAPQAIDLGGHFDRFVEQLLEQAVGPLGEGNVLMPRVGQPVERHPNGDEPRVALGVDVSGDLLEDDGGVAQATALGADPGVRTGTTNFGAWHEGSSGKEWGTKNLAPLPKRLF